MKLVYSDPKKQRLQKIEFAIVLLILPLGLFFGGQAYWRWHKFSQAEALALKAASLSQQGKTLESIPLLQQAVDLYPEYTAAWESLAVAYHMKRNFIAANETYRLAAAANPQNGDLCRDLATSYHYVGKHDEELECARRAILLANSDTLFTRRVLERAQREASGDIPKESLIYNNWSLVRMMEIGSMPDHLEHEGHEH